MQAYVLVVDDDEAVRNFIASLLSEEGYPVRSAGDAYQAMDQVGAEPPGLLLLDLMMPGVSGAEFLARLRRDERGQDLPVILISAHPRLREIAQDLHVEAAIPKPFDITSLLHHVSQVLGPPLPTADPAYGT
ncbi:MAG TPA: response regulator [Chloroflexia bacterium]|jgi:CheY-like chemotaxis protein|nr:response regulator [Chloroflexia bacterium]